MNKFRIFKQVPRIIFGKQSLPRLQELLSDNDGYRCFVVDDFDGKKSLEEKIKNLKKEQDHIEWFPAAKNEPTTTQVDEIRKKILDQHGSPPSAIIAIGGGSTLDVGKALSVLFTNSGSASEYQGWDLVKNQGVYKVGIPTVFGSGAEASRTAVLTGQTKKFGINSDFSMFDAIIIDSTLMESVSKEQLFFSGMDCYIHCVESLQGTMINELSKAYANKALQLCEKYFMLRGGEDELAVASYMGGVSIVNSEVGICHALSYGLSLELGMRHGVANCVAFRALKPYYGDYVEKFEEMVRLSRTLLPQEVCKNLDTVVLERMIDMTLKMDRPLQNALGSEWSQEMTRERIKDLYLKM